MSCLGGGNWSSSVGRATNIFFLSFGVLEGRQFESDFQSFGQVSEWFKELVLKTSDSERNRGFESHTDRLGFHIDADSFKVLNVDVRL